MLRRNFGLLAVAAIAGHTPSVAALDNGLALTPQMGWVRDASLQAKSDTPMAQADSV